MKRRTVRCEHGFASGLCEVTECVHAYRGNPLTGPKRFGGSRLCSCGKRIVTGQKCDHEQWLGFLRIASRP